MLKSFLELSALDLGQYTQKKPTFFKSGDKMVPTTPDKWLDYIEWSKILQLLYENGAEVVEFSSELHQYKPNTLSIILRIDGNEYGFNYPIIEGNTVIKEPNQLQIHKAELRGFVKAVAVYTGLGLSLWQKEEKILSELGDDTKIKVSAKKLLEGAKSVGELNRIWASLSENEQVKFKATFTSIKEKLV